MEALQNMDKPGLEPVCQILGLGLGKARKEIRKRERKCLELNSSPKVKKQVTLTQLESS